MLNIGQCEPVTKNKFVGGQVLEILSHVNKRVKHDPVIGLPLLELWNIYNEANAAPMVRNFCIVYIEMAFERAPVEVCGFVLL